MSKGKKKIKIVLGESSLALDPKFDFVISPISLSLMEQLVERSMERVLEKYKLKPKK
jgi:hypothetical protein